MNGGFGSLLMWGAKAGPENESTSQALAQQWVPVVCPKMDMEETKCGDEWG